MIHAANSLIDAIRDLKASEKFREWGKPRPRNDGIDVSCLMKEVAERHYSPAKVAEMWGISAETARVIFRGEPGVLKIGEDGTRYKRGYKTLRIPESVVERVHTRLSE